MAPTYIPIASTTLTTSAASVTFSAIPQTYTDLVLRISVRTNSAAASSTLLMTFNNDTTSLYSNTGLRGTGSATSSARGSSAANIAFAQVNANTSASNTFTSREIYIPSYTASQNKPVSVDNAHEDNETLAYREVVAGLYRSTTAISELRVGFATIEFVSGSTFHLYGISNT